MTSRWRCRKPIYSDAVNGISLTRDSYGKAYVISGAWMRARENYKYFKKSRYMRGGWDIYSWAKMKQKSYLFRKGDIAYLAESCGKYDIDHTTIITKIKNRIVKYTAHTNQREDYSLYNYFKRKGNNDMLRCLE